MKRIKTFIVILGILLIYSNLFGQTEIEKKGLEAITEKGVLAQLEFLSSDWTEGRETASKGNDLAADYIAGMFKVYGLKPAGDFETIRTRRRSIFEFAPSRKKRTYFQNFQLIEYKPGDNICLKVHYKDGNIKRTVIFNYKTDFVINVSDYAEEYTAPVVFVGYGITDKEKNYDDFENIDVRGKLVLRISGYPGHLDTTSNAYKVFRPKDRMELYRLRRKKNESLMKSGAIGVLEINTTGDISRSWVTNKPYRWKTPFYEGDTPPPTGYERRMKLVTDKFIPEPAVVQISNRIANILLKGSGINIEKFEKNVAENLTPASRILVDKYVSIKTSVNSKVVSTQNVLGYIEGENPDEIIVIGGHYDHLGKHKGYIWNGSDDNASGTVAVMEIAKAFMATGVKPKKSVVFATWSGEEKGLLGSKYFVDHPFKPLNNIVMNINFDMISRDSENDKEGNKVSATYTCHAVQLKEFLETYNKVTGLDLSLRGSSKPSGGSDFAPFAAKNIPIIAFMAGFHPDYHQPTDEVNKANIKKMTKIIKLGFLNAWKVANLEGKLIWDKNAKETGPRRPF